MIYLVTLLLTTATVFGTSSDVGSSTDVGSYLPEPTASRLAQLEDAGATETADAYNVSEIQDGMLVFIYNIDYRYTKLACQKPNDWQIFYDADINTGQLWRLVEDETRKGLFFLVNWASSNGSTTNRLAFNLELETYCHNGPKHDDQLWKFVKTTDGYWKIYNEGWWTGGKCGLAVWKDTEGGVYCGSENNGWTFSWRFRVKPAFDSEALWGVADDWENRTDQDLQYTFTYMEGITQSIEQTIAHSENVETSLSLSVEGAVEGIGLSASETMTVMESFSESYSNIQTNTWSVKRQVTLPVPAHTRICIKQLKVNMNQSFNNTPEFIFSSKYYRIDQGDDCN